MNTLTYILAATLIGCATTNPAIKEACSKPYADQDDRCVKPRPADTRGMVKVCRGSTRTTMICGYVSREDLMRVLRGI